MTPRGAAYETLVLLEKDGLYSNIAVDNTIKKYGFEGRDASLYTMLVYGVISKKITLDYIISDLCEKNPKRLDRSVLVLLRLGIYQLKYCTRIPDSAAVNETVKLSARYASRAKGLVNAVMHKACEYKLSCEGLSEKERLSVTYSVSEDIVDMMLEQYSSEAEKILAAFDIPPQTTITVNTLKTDVASVQEQLGAELGLYSDKALRLSENMPSLREKIQNGTFYVQDEASQICASILEAEAGMTVVDVCSCPGGKSFYTAISMGDKGKIYSYDIHENKLSLVKQGAERLGITIICTDARDARFTDATLAGKADRVICDVPCSGVGVIGKKPELRYKERSVFEELPEIQYDILKASSSYLRTGGILVYSTCTLNKLENEAIVRRFLAENEGFEVLDFKIKDIVSQNGMVTLLPHVNKTDGFFMARITKK